MAKHKIFKRNFFNIFILGIASGLPLALILSTLSIWLKELSISKTSIGLFALSTTPYALKFLWSPLIDGINIPLLSKKLGLRKSWLLVTQILLFLAIYLLAISQPESNLKFTAIMTLAIAFFSATQDIVIDAYRIEILPSNEQGLGATILIYGYRIGMLISGAGALILSEYMLFSQIYIVMGCLFILFGFFTITLPKAQQFSASETTADSNYMIWFKHHVIAPFKDFILRKEWLFIIIFIILFKLGDAFAGIMTNPFLLELGFSKSDIAFFVKIFGLGATLTGSLLGGILCLKCNMKFNLIFAAVIQMLTNFIFCIQAFVGYNKTLLALTIGMENLAGGIGTIVFVAYISNLCNIRYTATQYALLSSLAVIPRTWFSASSGWFADQLSWINFFLLSGVLAIPAILMACLLKKTIK